MTGVADKKALPYSPKKNNKNGRRNKNAEHK
jgi:hypothetical protein